MYLLRERFSILCWSTQIVKGITDGEFQISNSTFLLIFLVEILKHTFLLILTAIFCGSRTTDIFSVTA